MFYGSFCTFPDHAQARQIGTALIERQLAACVNFLPGVESIYHWEGKIETATEVLGIFKTTTLFACSPALQGLFISPSQISSLPNRWPK